MNIVLTGFMGTGKSVIGKNVANILGWKFIDIDTEIEKEAKKTIREIFNDDGEPFFRQLEKRVCHRISKYNKTVIATGGGTFIDIENKNSLSKNGIIICLKCKPEIILKRLTSDKNYIISRPLLAKPDPKANIENLLHERKNIYETIQLSIDTSNLSINETSRRIIDLYNQSKLNVNYPGGSYDVLIKHGLIHHIGEQLKNINVASHRKIIIVTNKTIAKYHLSDLSHSITNAGYEVIECFIPDGEQYKNINTVNKLYDDLIKEKVDRNALILAFGGGIVGDIAGYVAATYMRGVDFVNVPTSLLAMVDASIGGKTGYDHKEGKNLIGAFKQPVSVFIDPNLLRTLENSEILSGFS